MKKKLFLFFLSLVVGFSCFIAPSTASALLFTAQSGNLSASGDFEVSGSDLIITLTNTSLSDVLVPADILTGVFFTIRGISLTPDSALLAPGSTVYNGSANGGDVSGEWAYTDGLSGAPFGADQGISSSGLGLFGPGNLFGTTNLFGPVDPDGINYGITSAGDNTATGNPQVSSGTKQAQPLIRNAVIFTLSGLPSGFVLNEGDITHISFQYGTALNEPNVFVPVPEPATMLLFGSGLIGLAVFGRRRFFQQSKLG